MPEPKPPASAPRRDIKLASTVAERIRQDVIARGWRVGELLGGQQELIRRYGVSRAVLREAIRIVEYLGVARMRQGPGGGLVVAEPDETAATLAALIYLSYRGVGPDEVIGARQVVEQLAVELATVRSDDEQRAALRCHLESTADRSAVDFHGALALLSANPAVQLFGKVLQRVTDQYVGSVPRSAASRRRHEAEITDARTRIVDAIESGDPVLARITMRHLLEETERHVLSGGAAMDLGTADADHDLAGVKSSGAAAMRICSTIVARGWPIGELLGSEAQLMAEHDLSRVVLRQGVRLLEFLHVVRTRPGPGGGVFVAMPSIEAVIETMAVHLDSRGIAKHALFEVRRALEMATITQAATMLDAERILLLREAHEAEVANEHTRISEAGHDLHARIAELLGNRAIWLFQMVLIRLTEERGKPATREVLGEVHRAHAAIVSAISNRDPELAARRMQLHLDAMAPMVE